MTDPSLKPKRRWFQFSLRTLFLVTTLTAILFALLGWWSYKARRQREAVAALRKVGVDVSYDCSLPWSSGMDHPPKYPPWLLDKVGVDYFARVVVLTLEDTNVTDDDLRQLRNLAALQTLWLSGTNVTDAGLKQLKGLDTLQWLNLNNTHVSDTGLEYLKGLINLKSIRLSNTQVGDAGLEHLKDLTSLKAINLENTQVTDAGLEYLKNLSSLRLLDLRNTHVTDAGVARLQESLPNCKIDR